MRANQESNILAKIVAGGLGLHVHEFPSGKWGFVGSIPPDLMVETTFGTPQVGGNWRSALFATKEEAIAFAESKGHTPRS